MTKNRFCLILTALSSLLLCQLMFVSCNDDEETTTTKLYLDGYLSVGQYPYFIEGGTSITYHPVGITHPLGNDLGLYYKITNVTSYDTVYNALSNPLPAQGAEFTCTYPDSLATYTTIVTVYPVDADDFYTSSLSTYVTVVDSLLSCPEVNFDDDEPYFVDVRDNLRYNYNTLGGVRWMTKNLYWQGSGIAYYNSRDVLAIFGGYYNWREAVAACPEGWTLPTDSDWADLSRSILPDGTFVPGEDYGGVAAALMVDAYFNADKMWEFWPAVRISNSTKMRVIPSGFGNSATGEFEGMPDYACFWTANENPSDTTQAYFRYIHAKSNDLKIGSADKSSMIMNVRCIRK